MNVEQTDIDADFDAALASYLSSCEGAGSYRVLETLKSSDFEVTEKVVFCGRDGGELGPFVRKRIDAACGLGHAYERLMAAQRQGLRCPNLPRVLDCWNDGERLNALMEWLPGVTLEDCVREEGPSEELAREVAPQLACAVGLLHGGLGEGAPVIHRDLKPSNVMVVGGKNGLPRSFVLIDLGIARTWHEGAEADTTRLGTRSYAPPEQFGFGQTSVRSDVYALGAVLWFCLTGEDPAPGMGSRQLAERPDVPSDLRRVVAKAMSFDPEARYASAEELARAVEGRADGRHFSPAGPARREVPAAAGRAWNVVLALAVAVLTVASWTNVAAPRGLGRRVAPLVQVPRLWRVDAGGLCLGGLRAGRPPPPSPPRGASSGSRALRRRVFRWSVGPGNPRRALPGVDGGVDGPPLYPGVYVLATLIF